MTRVEAVADAIRKAFPRLYPSATEAIAEIAIEANDAWLAERGFKATPRIATEKMLQDGACCLPPTPEDSISWSVFEPGNSVLRDDASNDWERMWECAPNPDD